MFLVLKKMNWFWDFSGSPVVKTLDFHFRGTGLILVQGTEIPHAMG